MTDPQPIEIPEGYAFYRAADIRRQMRDGEAWKVIDSLGRVTDIPDSWVNAPVIARRVPRQTAEELIRATIDRTIVDGNGFGRAEGVFIDAIVAALRHAGMLKADR